MALLNNPWQVGLAESETSKLPAAGQEEWGFGETPSIQGDCWPPQSQRRIIRGRQESAGDMGIKGEQILKSLIMKILHPSQVTSVSPWRYASILHVGIVLYGAAFVSASQPLESDATMVQSSILLPHCSASFCVMCRLFLGCLLSAQQCLQQTRMCRERGGKRKHLIT